MPEIEEVEETAVETPIEEVSPRDDVNNDVAAAIASLKGEPAEPVEEVSEEPTAEPERKRGPDGKFLPKEAAPEAAAAPEPKSATPEAVTKPSEAQPSTAAVAAPVSWSPDAKTQWATLPPAIQAAVAKREAEVSAGFRQYSDQVRRYETALAPVAKAAERRGIPVEEGIKALYAAQDYLDRDPKAAIAWLAQAHGVDLAEIAANPPAVQQRPAADPVFAQVTNTVTALEQRLASIEFGHTLDFTTQWAASKPYYADVEDSLPDLIKEVKAVNPHLPNADVLEKAYERAIWLNPEVRAKVLAAEQAEAEQARHTQVQQKAVQAQRAAVSIKGSSAPAAPPQRRQDSGGDVYDEVRNAIQQLRAG